jgi:hypothetical protein
MITRVLLALFLAVLSPLCAEYLVGYDTSTGRPLALLGNLLIFIPLYGAAALLIREVARRRQLGWLGILALAAAAALLQAGVIDQSLFSVSYRQIDYWQELVGPTWIKPFGFAASTALSFLVGHIVYSYTIPILMVEAISPRWSHRPWLGRVGLAITAMLYLAASGVVLGYHLRTEQDHASAAQVISTLVLATVLVVIGLTFGRTTTSSEPSPGGSSSGGRGAWLVGVLGLAAGLILNFAPSTWAGFTIALSVVVATALSVTVLARRPFWGPRHRIALATGALLAQAATGFLVDPIGDVAPFAKYAHNAFFLLGATLLGAWAWRQNSVYQPLTQGRERSSAT